MRKIFLFLLPAVMLFAAGCKDKNEPEQGQSQEQGQGQGEEQGGTQTDTLRVYTVFDAASGVMTYYCDNKMNSRAGDYKEIFIPKKDYQTTRLEAYKYYSNVKKVVIDPSMKDYPYTSMCSLFGKVFDAETKGSKGLENMTEIEGIENLHTENVTDMRIMFCGCSSLKSLDLRAFNIAKLETAYSMFLKCTSLETIYCNDDWSQSAVLTVSDYMFEDCLALEGGKGTKYYLSKKDKTYARPDGGTANPGYFTPVKELNPIAFSVAKANQVFFAHGNLIHHPSGGVWRLATNQYDIEGDNNSKIARYCEQFIDLFGWGTAEKPYESSTSTSDYPTVFTDWGTNTIANNYSRTWRTLTAAEWEYVFERRANADSLFGFGSINGTNGLILLPDGWTLPAGSTFVPSTENGFVDKGTYYQGSGNAYASNSYTESQWAPMEKAGAVFLPAAGSRWSKNVSEVNEKGYYWSATPAEEDGKAYCIYFHSKGYSVRHAASVSCGYSVRLVCDVE